MNYYTFELRALCPNGKLRDRYNCTLCASFTIPVERIVAVVGKLARRRSYQEDIADHLRNEFMARVTVVGWHYGVKVTCERE